MDKKDTIFDDVFRTILEKMPQLMIPLINEVFHTTYTSEDLKAQLKNEHVDVVLGKKRTTDSLLYIGDKRYHLECQKNPDSTIAVRMFEYDVTIAVEESRKNGGNEIVFPESGLLYLTHNKSVGNSVCVPVRFQDGYVHPYEVPVLKAQEYSKEDIFQKELYVLLPYYVLRYEKAFAQIDKDVILQEQLAGEYENICEQLSNAVEPAVYNELAVMMKEILERETREYANIRERMVDVMGGEVMELYSERLIRLERSAIVEKLIEKQGLTAEEACELVDLKVEDYAKYKESQEQQSLEQRADELLVRNRGKKL